MSTTESPSHGLSQVCRGFGHIAGPSFPLHIRRQGRCRRVHLDLVQRNKAGKLGCRKLGMYYLHRLTIAALGGWIELQHLLIRHHGQEEPAAARKERAEETANIATPRRCQSPRHCRGMRCDRHSHASELIAKQLPRQIHTSTSLPSGLFLFDGTLRGRA